jgi:ubiquinone/menaquinone biosynthesis C-methylase UbiE
VSDSVIPIDAAPVFDENEAAVIDTFVVPSYLRLFWEASSGMLLVGEAGRVIQLGSLTGYPASEILERMPHTTGVGIDRSEACASLAAQRQPEESFTYLVGEPSSSGLQEHSFSHALLMHPMGGQEERRALFTEAARLLYAGGQALIAMPLSRSFPEILDLIEEFSLKYDDASITRALQLAAAERVTVESISEELEAAGFSDIDFEVHNDTIGYDSGRAFLEDPSVRYFIAPQIESWLDQLDLASAMEYVGRAIDKYWSDTRMDLGISIVAFSARR